MDATNKFTWTTEVLWRKRDGMAILSRGEHLNPCLDRLYWLSNSIHQRRFSFIMLRSASGNYFLQIAKERMLLINKKKMLQTQGNDKSNWSGYTSILGRISTDFRKLL